MLRRELARESGSRHPPPLAYTHSLTLPLPRQRRRRAPPPLLDPRPRTVPLPAPRTRVRSRATGSETNRRPQICKQRSEEPSAAARRRPPPSSFSHPPHPRSRPRRDRCSALPPQRHRTYIYAIFYVRTISTMSRAPEGAHSRTPALASGADTDPPFVAVTKQRPAGAWESRARASVAVESTAMWPLT